jgi:hypothetical protein
VHRRNPRPHPFADTVCNFTPFSWCFVITYAGILTYIHSLLSLSSRSFGRVFSPEMVVKVSTAPVVVAVLPVIIGLVIMLGIVCCEHTRERREQNQEQPRIQRTLRSRPGGTTTPHPRGAGVGAAGVVVVVGNNTPTRAAAPLTDSPASRSPMPQHASSATGSALRRQNYMRQQGAAHLRAQNNGGAFRRIFRIEALYDDAEEVEDSKSCFLRYPWQHRLVRDKGRGR